MLYDELSYEHEGVPVKIIHDTDADYANPRENQTNLGTFLHWHRRYNLGDAQISGQEDEAMRRGGMKLLMRYLTLVRGATVVIPVGLLDHSGLHVWAGGGAHWSDSAGWDSGTVGVIFDTPESRKETGAPLDTIERQLRAEVEEYDQFIRGEVYGYVVAEGTSEEESCWGFIGLEYAKEAANEAADGAAPGYKAHQQRLAHVTFQPETLT